MGKKKKSEIKRLAEAAKIAHAIWNDISKKVKPGVRENEIASAIEGRIKEKGLRRSFKTIVASGPNAAKPHAKLTKRAIQEGDAVVIDFGVLYKGYRSDITRTVAVGALDAKMRKLYTTVKNAQAMAIRMARPGLKISSFVGSVNNYIRKKGLGRYILHTLGHGIGRKVHEPPKLSERNKRALKENMVITIEPGLYINGKGGVRVEDMILLTKNGRKVLA